MVGAGRRDRLYQIHDNYFRALFSDTQVASAFCQERLPAWAVAGLGEWHPEPAAATLVNGALHSHQPDLLFRIVGAAGPSAIYCLLEHKSWPDPEVPVQLDRSLSAAQSTLLQEVGHDGPLPVLIPYVLYHGRQPWKVPRRFPNLPSTEAGTSGDERTLGLDQPEAVGFVYGLVDVGHEPERQLARHPWLLAGLLALRFAYQADRQHDANALARVLALLHGAPDLLVDATRTYMLRAYKHMRDGDYRKAVRLATPVQEESMYSKAVQKWMADGETKGRKEGRTEGKAEALIRLVEHRFGALSDKRRARIAAAAPVQLDAWLDRIFDAPNLAELIEEK